MKKKIKEEDLFIPKTKHKGLKITLAIILIVALAALGYFLYQEKFNNPKTTVMNAILDAEKNVSKLIINEDDDAKYKINGLLKIDATLPNELKEIASILKNLDLQFSGEIDTKNTMANITLNTKYKNEPMLDIKSYYENKNLYLLLDGLYDKYLKISLDNLSKEQNNIEIPEINIDTKDINVLSKSITKALEKALNELEFTKEDATITIDGKEYNVTNNYTVLKDKDINKFAKDFINALSNDNEFTKVFKKITNEDYPKTVDELVKEIDQKELTDTIKINFYTQGLLKKQLVSMRINIIDHDEITEINFDKISDNEFMILAKANGMEISSRIKKTNAIANINMIVDMTGIRFKIDLNTNYEKIKELTKPDTSNSKDIDKLTEKETQDIGEKLLENSSLKSLIEDIQKINLNKS